MFHVQVHFWDTVNTTLNRPTQRNATQRSSVNFNIDQYYLAHYLGLGPMHLQVPADRKSEGLEGLLQSWGAWWWIWRGVRRSGFVFGFQHFRSREA